MQASATVATAPRASQRSCRPQRGGGSALPDRRSRTTPAPMDPERLRRLLEQVRAGATDVEGALQQLRRLPFQDLGFAHVDHHRALRQGVPEVIFGESKTALQIAGVARALVEAGQPVLVTRLDPAKARELSELLPELVYREASRTASHSSGEIAARPGEPVLVI